MAKKVGEAHTENPVGRSGDRVQFHAPSVSASADGDYYRLWLGLTESYEENADPHEMKGPYLIVQRQLRSKMVSGRILSPCPEFQLRNRDDS